MDTRWWSYEYIGKIYGRGMDVYINSGAPRIPPLSPPSPRAGFWRVLRYFHECAWERRGCLRHFLGQPQGHQRVSRRRLRAAEGTAGVQVHQSPLDQSFRVVKVPARSWATWSQPTWGGRWRPCCPQTTSMKPPSGPCSSSACPPRWWTTI